MYYGHMLKRSPFVRIWEELVREKSMVFLSGPRQCGKTTLAKMIADGYNNSTYFNWDVLTDKRRLIDDPYFFQDIERKDFSTPSIVLDEIHKYKDWRSYLKGAYDRFHEQYIFLVTGSGRLDLYRRGGESLAGRYRHFHLWPLTCAELQGQNRSLEASAIIPWMSATAIGSIPAKGSSSSMKEGLITLALHISTRLRSPPESSTALLLAR